MSVPVAFGANDQGISLAVSTVTAWKLIRHGTIYFKCNAVCKGQNSGSSFVLHEDFSENPKRTSAVEILDVSCFCGSHRVPVGTGMVLVGVTGYRHFVCSCACGHKIKEEARGKR